MQVSWGVSGCIFSADVVTTAVCAAAAASVELDARNYIGHSRGIVAVAVTSHMCLLIREHAETCSLVFVFGV